MKLKTIALAAAFALTSSHLHKARVAPRAAVQRRAAPTQRSQIARPA